MRWLHKNVANVLVFFLTFNALTGLIYILLQNFTNFSFDSIQILITAHTFNWIEGMGWYYTTFLSVASLLMVYTGYLQLRQPFFDRSNYTFHVQIPTSYRTLHSTVASFALFFLGITALTGGLYQLLKSVFNFSPDSIRWLITLHTGNYFEGMKFIYVPLNFIIIVIIIFSGLNMLSWYKKWKSRKVESSVLPVQKENSQKGNTENENERKESFLLSNE